MPDMLPPVPSLPALAALGACAVLASAASGARVAVAAECQIALTGAPAEGWAAALSELQRSEAAPGDCAEVSLEASGERARLVFVTRDGRRAERKLDHPEELLPALLALGVRAAGAGIPLASAPDAAPAPAPSALEPVGMEPVLAPAVEPPPVEARAVFSLLGGTRGGTDSLLGPAFGGSAAIELDRWELGVNLLLEAQYFDVGGGEPRAPSSAVSVGVTVGRREPVGDLDVLCGARISVAALNDESQRDSGERGRAELRLGTYLGGAWPRDAGLRLRADLSIDVVPHRVLGAAGTRITPWLGASALVGVEFNGP